MIQKSPCPGCGAMVPVHNGPTHRYIGASAGCWGIYGEVLAREYENVAYFASHRLSADTYMVQHPGTPSPQSIQSVNIHLIGLYHTLVLNSSSDAATKALQQAVTIHKGKFEWLEPPDEPGKLTILDVYAAKDAVEHAAVVRRWAESVWEAWAAHHDTIKRLAEA